jgi:enoyl-CoA hydratase/carnithine racemase
MDMNKQNGDMPGLEMIKYEKEDGFVTLTLNRPKSLNALNRQMQIERNLAFRQILKDPEVKAFIITGAPRPDGRPCFCAGADLKEDAQGIPRWEDTDVRGPGYIEEDELFPSNTAAGMLWSRRPRLDKPILIDMAWAPKISIAAIDGVCTAGGIEFALACDIIVCSETAMVFDSHVKNLQMAIGGGAVCTNLTRRVGYSKALELCLTGDPIDGKEAKAIGFANMVFPPDKMLAEAKNLARKIAGMRPAAVHYTKLSCRSVFDRDYNALYSESLEWSRLQIHEPDQGDGWGSWSGLAGSAGSWAQKNKERNNKE